MKRIDTPAAERLPSLGNTLTRTADELAADAKELAGQGARAGLVRLSPAQRRLVPKAAPDGELRPLSEAFGRLLTRRPDLAARCGRDAAFFKVIITRKAVLLKLASGTQAIAIGAADGMRLCAAGMQAQNAKI